jgi:hypothetical protein
MFLVSFFILIAGCILFIYASTFTLFDVNVTKVMEIHVPSKSYKLGVFHVPSNAVSQCYIQIRQLDSGDVLQSYERYNYVNDYRLFGDTLRLTLSDTSFRERCADTIYLKLP